MPTLREVAYGLYGAWRLLRLDRGAMAYFDRSIDGFWKSFFAAALVAPGYAVLLLMDTGDAAPSSGILRLFAVHLIAYAVGWVAFPLAAHYLTEAIDRGADYLGFIVAFNWARVIQIYLLIPPRVLGVSGLLPSGFAAPLIWSIFFAVLGYKWFIARTALSIPGTTAAGVVVLDLVLDLIVISAAKSMLG